MFAPHTQSHFHTTHLTRTYGGGVGAQTTSKKNLNKENANAPLPSKTPSRAGPSAGPLKLGGGGLGTVRRGLGPKTEGRDRNVLAAQQEGGHGGGKGKGREGDDIAPKKLFQSTSKNPQPSLAPSKSFASLPPLQLSQKTPAPSRRLPPSTSRNTLRTPAPSQQHVPEPTPLPSATRRRRSRNSGATPDRQMIRGFETPAPSGQKWEPEEGDQSLGSIEGVQLREVREADEEEDMGGWEVEYMPPKVQPLKWEPPFELADGKAIFETLARAPVLWDFGEEDIPTAVPEPDLSAPEVTEMRRCDDDELEEPMFRRPKAAPAAKSNPGKPAIRQPGRVAPSAMPIRRPGTATNPPAAAPTKSSVAPRQANTLRTTTPAAKPLSAAAKVIRVDERLALDVGGVQLADEEFDFGL